jgi:tRNA 5-methylaminomethyl-2-thiouridine biosynthesis bifunctional protein
VVPTEEGDAHILGATYARRDEVPGDDWTELRADDHAENLAGLREHFPALKDAEVIGGRTALRATVRDYLPLAGKVGNGTWILGGLGSRGFLTAPLLAECVADLMTGAVPALPPDLLGAVDPVRFKKKG